VVDYQPPSCLKRVEYRTPHHRESLHLRLVDTKSTTLFWKVGEILPPSPKRVVENLPPEPQRAIKIPLQPKNVVQNQPLLPLGVVENRPRAGLLPRKHEKMVEIEAAF
jgi:hypothetical protein